MRRTTPEVLLTHCYVGDQKRQHLMSMCAMIDGKKISLIITTETSFHLSEFAEVGTCV